jgi:hypothetical protein
MNSNISAWRREQLAVWIARQPNYDDASSEFKHVNATDNSVALFDFRDGNVSIVEKIVYDGENSAGREMDVAPVIRARSEAYRDFFRRVVMERQPRFEGLLAMSMGDGSFLSESAPFFSFQKGRGETCILINDIDSLVNEFYENIGQDDLSYLNKKNSGAFAGSTTGCFHSVDSIKRLESQRIRSAMFFKNSPLVEFSLTNIVQCAEPEAEELLRTMGFGNATVSWEKQLEHKFLLSMDGNGATCSRVALGLKSNSALVKYNSNSELYYFSGLQPWKHFIPVAGDKDVRDVITAEIRQEGLFQDVASEGRQFYEQCLRREPTFDYAAEILEGYYSLFDRPSTPRASNMSTGSNFGDYEVVAFGSAHIANIGNVDAVAGEFGHPNRGRAIEGARIFSPVYNRRKAKLAYSAIYAGAENTEETWVEGGMFAGTVGENKPLLGLRLRRSENNDQNFLCRITASFINGFQIDTGYGESVEVVGSAPLEAFRVHIKFIAD